ncbi:MAG: hypothetical protein REI45_16100, partial [Propionicimonas sp.]|nr:hypothetical protein [Propionicimonas sp.]
MGVADSVAQSYPLPTSWSVSGLGASGTGELNTEVADFAEIDGVMYVGGNFRYVQRNAAGTDRVEQSYLAAFDVETGAWIPGFRPVLDNQVKALAALPDGSLAVGGAFSTVNGASSPAFTALDPTTGEVVSALDTRLINYTGGVPPAVRSFDVQDGYLYIGGRFTHMTGGGRPNEVYLRNLGRIDVTNGRPDASWHPLLDGTVVDVDASDRGDRVYAAGYFGLSNWDTTTLRAGAFTAADATVVPWSVNFSNTSGGRIGYQQAVREVGDRVWLGGSEHMLFSYDRDTMAELSTNITQNGGDFQSIADDGDHVIAGCHCSENVYQGARWWPDIRDFYRAEHINQAGYWRADTGAFVPDFSPTLSMREGSGAWAITRASDGSLWLGGDFTHARARNTNNQWTGGFVRFGSRDTTPPEAPSDLVVRTLDNQDTLTWQAPGGQDDTVRYEVLRQDRAIASTTNTTLTLPRAGDDPGYVVRGVDAAGNRSSRAAVGTSTAA